MKILMLSWEYPPKSVGGLSNHVYHLSKGLSKLGHEVHVITCGDVSSTVEEIHGVYVHTVVPYGLDTEDFTKWVMHLNFAMAEEAVRLINSNGKFDIIHGHDWLSAYAAKMIKGACSIPMVCTIHATEHGRNNGIRTEMQRYISSAEWMLTYEAWKVIACSEYMRSEIHSVFDTPLDKLSVIPNGIDLNEFEKTVDSLEFRRKYAKDDEKLIVYVGRHVYEKGIQLLIEAAPDIISNYYNVKFIIAGKGVMTDELKDKVRYLGLENNIVFTGYIDEEEKALLYKSADAAVVPSLYEPFGISALEAMAAGCPAVVSDIGGLKDIIEHKINGIKILPGSKDSIRDNILELLNNEQLRKSLSEKGLELICEKYIWDRIALSTVELYEKVKEEATGTEWEITETKAKKKTVRKKKIEETTVEESAVDLESKTKTKRTRKKTSV